MIYHFFKALALFAAAFVYVVAFAALGLGIILLGLYHAVAAGWRSLRAT